MATNIQRRGTVFYFRRKIPLDLIEQHSGKREIIRSLGTRDRAEAERLARKVSVELDDAWQVMRAESGPAPWPDDTDFLEVGGKLIPFRTGPAPAPRRATRAEIEAAELADQEASGLHIADEYAEEAAEEEADKLMRVIGIVERRRAQAGQGPIPPAVKAAIAPQRASTGQPAKPKPAASEQTLESIIPLWQRDRQPTAKTVDAVTRAVREAKDPDIHTITRQAIIAMRDRWIAAGNSVATTNKKIGFVRLLLGIAKSRGLIENNYAEGAELPPPKRAVELRKPYSPEQAEAVMAATEGARESDPAMYWLPRLARWTGARLNELHQLRKDDVQAREGVPGLMITDDGEHDEGVALRLKNEGSRRWVPLAEPVRDFAEWVGTRSDGPLFPSKADKHGIVSAAFSKRYGRLLRKTLKIEDKRITFHSWRHGFADMCRAAGIAPDVRMALMGHTEGGVSGTYGAGDGLPARRLIEAVELLSLANTLSP
ncbi:hypothetical protein D9X30_4845 [Cupriavidus sp. U2]|uniref:site-specific integrase n=1 Tax=Cupriavidus sp. U2 TaxID=2920269 RepID=UPI00129EE98D|nr:site-specific integrase [Cupriavidus sp. U2]KAI3590237.1 hypothetical protein D9X30_4845 [Cupriavidus sp. U2]